LAFQGVGHQTFFFSFTHKQSFLPFGVLHDSLDPRHLKQMIKTPSRKDKRATYRYIVVPFGFVGKKRRIKAISLSVL